MSVRCRKLSAFIQRHTFKPRYFGCVHSDTMPFCARVWVEHSLRTEALINMILFDENHCWKSWKAWCDREGIHR